MEPRIPINFAPSTIKAVKLFNTGLEQFKKKNPDISLFKAREYLNGRLTLPKDTEDEIDNLNGIRKEAIQYQMSYADAQAKSEGITIPEKYITGQALDVYFAESTYRFYDFFVFKYFSWYEPWEEAYFTSEEAELFAI